MVNLIKRMSKLRAGKEIHMILSLIPRFEIDLPAFAQLLEIRLGPGAAILPPEVTRIHLDLAYGLAGHLGPRHFWRRCLPRLKYHNPAVPMTVNRTTDTSDPATLTIHFSTPPNPTDTPTTYTKTIECKHRGVYDILHDLMELTKAQKVLPTVADRQLQRELAAEKIRNKQNSLMSAAVNAKARAEKAILDQARGEVAAASTEA
ncbi:hypothetical protein DSL72_002910 [Monilinia vaccinii-corymbosi]|uniref:Ribosomal protein/NADH dehydrogenase domain-containing protein n=1 Tax=Monilinia vaccinii-corymbosi TaxID=61207 RepID=A0A8A3PDQ2_9HELO|nr:hypothetical protein DSL72_002910 [Monilinia vaccinii-corymbosi]